ncbi:MAG: 1-acyl-sn-glycerol-3-phosphate acyltransferase [Rhodospirillales bacterium]|nr:1-acyl-sn-glycerol-3-phosphate acyltransferase [Rhodospirillales bacterium]
MSRLLRFLFFALIVRPIIYVLLGLNVRNYKRLPNKGPAILVANHNSHLDTLVLMSLIPLSRLSEIHPVAAADYFLRNKLLSWFALEIIGIIPIRRASKGGNPLRLVFDAIQNGKILILFPEGTRGQPEKMEDQFKEGIRLIARKFPDMPVYPIFLHGLGKSLPKGEGLFVPFFCDIFIGEPLTYQESGKQMTQQIHSRITALAAEGQFPAWE